MIGVPLWQTEEDFLADLTGEGADEDQEEEEEGSSESDEETFEERRERVTSSDGGARRRTQEPGVGRGPDVGPMLHSLKQEGEASQLNLNQTFSFLSFLQHLLLVSKCESHFLRS